MRYQSRKPQAPLADFVEYLWIYSDYRPNHRFGRVLPMGTVELVINLSDDLLYCYDPESFERIDTVRGPLLAGPLDSFNVFDTNRKIEIMGAHFRPAGAAALLDMPVSEVAGREIPLSDCWGAAAGELRERLAEASESRLRLSILEDALLTRLRPSRPLHPAVRAALPAFEVLDSNLRIGQLADGLGLSSRRFIEVFTAQVGMTPKAYGRVRRFQGVIDRIHLKEEVNWSEVALECGYYDQAHFIRDFKSFSGVTPGAYQRLRGPEKNHIPVPDRGMVHVVSAENLPAKAA